MRALRASLILVAICALASGGVVAGSRAAPPERLNLISIVTDDQGRWAVGAYGNKEIQTPNMDRLAREGALFTNAFVVTPVCSPSRATFLTGRYPTELGITDWIAPVEADAGLGMPTNVVTWPQVLQRNGYRTGLIGKWHLGWKPEHHPTKRGFHHFFGFLGGGARPVNPTLEQNGKDKRFDGPLPDILTDDALRFVERNRARPFALSLHFRAPHLPYGPVPEVDSAPFKDLDPTIPKARGIDVQQVKKWTRDYYASIHSVDRNIGRLLDRLDELKLTGKTIVMFTSDHGYMIGHHGIHTKGNGVWVAGGVNGPKRPNMFEDAIRVPLIIRWPGVAKPGSKIDAHVSTLDTFRSVLGMLDVPAPKAVQARGVDFSETLKRSVAPATGAEEVLFGQYDLHNSGLAFMRMLRTPEWKLVRYHYANFQDELYDLKNDPGETRNLYRRPQHREVRERMEKQLRKYEKAIDDPILRAEREPINRKARRKRGR